MGNTDQIGFSLTKLVRTQEKYSMWSRVFIVFSLFSLLSGCAATSQSSYDAVDASGTVLHAQNASYTSPDMVVHRYFRALSRNDVDAFLACLHLVDPSLQGVREMTAMLVGSSYSRFQELGGLQSVRTVILQQDSNSATVGAYLVFHNGSIRHGGLYSLVKGEDWRIDVSPQIE